MQLGRLNYAADERVQVAVISYSAHGPATGPDLLVLCKDDVMTINVEPTEDALPPGELLTITLQITRLGT